jgi:hypothetical protein
MKKLALFILVLAAVTTALVSVFAQTSPASWPYFAELTTPGIMPGTYDLPVPVQVLDKARGDLADLRLFDSMGREIPYALRIRKDIDRQREIPVRLFNQASLGPAASEVSMDLGENAGEHNEVEIETDGTNFRRRVNVEGSDLGTDWRTLQTGAVIFRFTSAKGSVASNRVSYPISRYRYLRARIFADELTDRGAPVVVGARVSMAFRQQGERATWNATLGNYQLLRNQGAPASAWTIDLGGRVPCDRLILEVADESFSRPFQLEAVDDPQNIKLVASGELTRRTGERQEPLVITFNEEEQVRKLRLMVNDFSNQSLSISSINASAPARQVVFQIKDPQSHPLRLFFGNPKATPPHYDFEKNLPAQLNTTPVRTEVGPAVSNPNFKPEPLPLTERVPWLIYVVLAASSLALAMILISLARTAQRTEARSMEENAVLDERGA